ncbi:hypothetical protein BT69DRAFT_1282212, partial [Atractiella rhizophila]
FLLCIGPQLSRQVDYNGERSSATCTTAAPSVQGSSPNATDNTVNENVMFSLLF